MLSIMLTTSECVSCLISGMSASVIGESVPTCTSAGTGHVKTPLYSKWRDHRSSAV